jgi:hypothetical protein
MREGKRGCEKRKVERRGEEMVVKRGGECEECRSGWWRGKERR